MEQNITLYNKRAAFPRLSFQRIIFIRYYNVLKCKLQLATCKLLIPNLRTMEHYTLKNVSNCLDTKIYSYLETSGGLYHKTYYGRNLRFPLKARVFVPKH
jgi:hypothetical protein